MTTASAPAPAGSAADVRWRPVRVGVIDIRRFSPGMALVCPMTGG